MSDAIDRLNAALAGRYAIERELGSGGMATVYLAEDLRHHRKVALKVMHPELAATLGSARFLREIETAARLQHPHILPLHDSGEADGFLYFVMPFVEGESLRTRLAREGELPVGDAVRLLRDVVDALSHAHAQGVVHRDIKPDNVLLSGRHAMVTDFGVAKAVSEATGRHGLTTAGVALGTPTYMAPEQAAADTHIDQRADIYAVGALAYELLTGHPPFEGTSAQQVLAAHLTQAPVPVTGRRPAVPPALEAVVMRCLEKKPADRWQTADDLMAQLEGFVTPTGGITPTTTRPVVGVRRVGVRRWVVLAGAAALAVAIGGGVWALLARSGGPGGKPRIVVLPPRNLGPPEQAYVADGIAEEINNRLVGVAGLEVIGRTSAERYRDTQLTPRQIGAELDADYLLALRVGSEGPANARRLRVSAELVRGATEAQLWGKSFTAQAADDYFQVQGEIATEVASEMGVALGAGERERLAARPTANAEAYDYYLRATAAWSRGLSLADFRDAAERYARAAELDPDFTLAWVGLGLAHIELYWFWGDRSDRRRAMARDALSRAAALAPDLPEVHFTRGVFQYHGFLDYEGALAEMRRAVEQDPGRAEFHEWIGYVLRRSGRFDEAVSSLERALPLDPQSGRLLVGLGGTYRAVRRYRDAERVLERAVAVSPTDWNAHSDRVATAVCVGDIPEAGRRAREGIDRIGVAGILADRPELVTQWLPVMSPADRSVFDPFPPITASMSDTGAYYLQRATARRALGHDARADVDSAIVIFERSSRERPDEFKIHMWLSQAYAAAGRRADAVRAGEAAVARATKDGFEGPFTHTALAEVYARFGEPDRAAEQLERFIAALPFGRDWVRYRPEYAALRDHARVRRLLAA